MKSSKFRLVAFSILAISAYVFMLADTVSQNFDDFKLGFKDGLNAGLADKNIEEGHSVYYLNLKPKEEFQSFPDSMTNLRNNQQIKYGTTGVKVRSDFDSSELKQVRIYEIMEYFFVILMMIIMVYAPVLFFKIIFSLMKEIVFDKENILRLKKLGLALIVLTLAEYAFDWVAFARVQGLFEIKNYKIVCFNDADVIWLLIGFIVLIFAEVLSRGIKMKEEQELTI